MAKLAAEARKLGWERDLSADHRDLERRAVYQMGLIAFSLRAAGEPRWLYHAYQQEFEDYQPTGRDWWETVIPPKLLRVVARAAPARWVAEVVIAADGRRRTGRALKLVSTCRRLQETMIRHGVEPLGRATAPIRDGERTRGWYLLARDTELEGEEGWSLFWGVQLGGGVSRAPARTTREPVDDEGWEGGAG